MRGPTDVLRFWFKEHGPEDWFAGRPEFDANLAEAFTETHAAVARGEAWQWRATPEGRLAEIIVLDQFSRQLRRGEAGAFACDGMALVLAQEMVAAGFDRTIAEDRRTFVYMPYMHSESLRIHAEAERLFSELGNEETLDYERRHAAIISRFQRYPSRNEALGRVSTPEELEYLQQAGDDPF